ncbi:MULTISPECIES: M67 family metallopeptidase [unclassified Prochlorococcus]|uniref:M67 family metallopeptidase n=1 Tax=unclassified Prochlorococcus TaxID=2627481 RepID=UPI000533B6D3|nr:MULTISPECIES: M67 family metallopeptidase [unclassified Prochlorococcus]KGG14665.1 hypothetical protein EV06_1725 [Prochlorococcus sp. MIT 0602]KGG15905.1 hypothetical protein EV07_1872 [Prochlorococcus sp. MIT 0603]
MPNPDGERTEPSKETPHPKHVEFHKETEQILKGTLFAVTPQEGCAILIGKLKELSSKRNTAVFQIQLIWPCCNVWTKKIENQLCASLNIEDNVEKELSRVNRFALDPYEQIAAQKWARTKNLKVLGIAHSHPFGSAKPSKIDLSMNFLPNLMIILSGDKTMRGWWLNKPKSKPIEIPIKLKEVEPMFF